MRGPLRPQEQLPANGLGEDATMSLGCAIQWQHLVHRYPQASRRQLGQRRLKGGPLPIWWY
jgi:hypothetical protein